MLGNRGRPPSDPSHWNTGRDAFAGPGQPRKEDAGDRRTDRHLRTSVEDHAQYRPRFDGLSGLDCSLLEPSIARGQDEHLREAWIIAFHVFHLRSIRDAPNGGAARYS